MILSIIIPVLNEEEALPVFFKKLGETRRLLPEHEVIVVDGGSADKTVEIARREARVLPSPRGRGPQMNAGAAAASGKWLLFLHADCSLTPEACRRMSQICNEDKLVGGCFSQRIGHPNPLFRWIAFTGNLRARLKKIFYGDQGIFVRRDVFEKLGGYPDFPILEDIAFTEKLGLAGPVAIQKEKILCSARRWKKMGMLQTHWLYFRVVRRYRRGVAPAKLKEMYLDVR